MPQLMAGISLTVQTRHGQVLFDQRVDGGAADALILTGQEQCIPILAADGTAHLHVTIQRVLAGTVEVHHAHLIALAQHPQGVVLYVGDVQPDQLGDTQPAVQKQRQDAVIPLPVRAVHRLQQGEALVQRQIAGESLHLLRRVHVLAGIFLQKMSLIADIVEKRPDRSQFSGS